MTLPWSEGLQRNNNHVHLSIFPQLLSGALFVLCLVGVPLKTEPTKKGRPFFPPFVHLSLGLFHCPCLPFVHCFRFQQPFLLPVFAHFLCGFFAAGYLSTPNMMSSPGAFWLSLIAEVFSAMSLTEAATGHGRHLKSAHSLTLVDPLSCLAF